MPKAGPVAEGLLCGRRARPWPAWLAGLLFAAVLVDTAAAAAWTLPDTVEQRAQACTACHASADQQVRGEYVPRIDGKPAPYLAEQLVNFRDRHRRHGVMNGLLEGLPDDVLMELAEHFAARKPAGRAPGAGASSASPTSASAQQQRADRLIDQGDPARGLPACAACHGSSLQGQGPVLTGLVGLPRDYIVAQLGAWRAGVRQARAPDCMADVARRLSLDEVVWLADALARRPSIDPLIGPSAGRPANTSMRDGTPGAALPLDCGSVKAWAGAGSPLAREPGATAPSRPIAPGTQANRPPAPSGDQVEQGRYLSRLGLCASCHTQPGGAPYAGGRGIATPFGTVMAGNLTPDDRTGLGAWSADDFWRALHHGRSRDGRALSPAFPYTSTTLVSRDDSDALFAYLQTLEPVHAVVPPHDLRWPFGTRWALAAWQWLFFKPGSVPSAAGLSRASQGGQPQTAQWQRGAWLVQGPGHCAACHAPRNALGALRAGMGGALMPGGWWATSLQPEPLDTATVDDAVQMLKTGMNRFGGVSGPMKEVVRHGTAHWRDDDLRAAVVYLRSLQPLAWRPPTAAPAPAPTASTPPLGQALYDRACADCHGPSGQGALHRVPPLAGNPSVLQPQVHNLVRVLKEGGFGVATAHRARPMGMPPSGLSEAEVAEVLTYIRGAWGNQAGAVSALDVLRAR